MPDPNHHPVFPYAHTLVERVAELRPSSATMWGVAGHDHRWEDLSPEGIAEVRSLLVAVRSEIDALPAATEEWSVLAVDILRTWVEQELADIDSGQPWRWLDHIASPFQMLHLALTHMDKAADADAIRARLAGLPQVLEGYRESLAHGLEVGERVAARQVRSCIAQGRNLVQRRLLDIVPGPEADAAHQAYAALTAWLEDTYLPQAEPADGVGEDRYLPAARRFLHDELDLDATYAWGWELVHELHTELQAILGRVAPGETLEQAVVRWRTHPDTSAAGADAFLERVRGWQARALADLDGVLPVPDIARELRIERAPGGLPPGAWYLPPSEDGKRPGTVQYSLPEGRVPLFDQQSTACHEGFPGHHLQLAIQTTLRGRLSRLHRLGFHCTGFAEGWALYAERLVDERGGYESDVQRVGYLVNQIARACRVVLDIGLHTGRSIPSDVPLPTDPSTGVEPGAPWTYERAVHFMTGIGGLRREVSESEITRYLGWPGQAISYSVGMRRMLELRDRFLGRGGSLLGFHEQVLGAGTVGLGRLASSL